MLSDASLDLLLLIISNQTELHLIQIRSSHNSEIIAMIGSIFLWMFWPSFNGALATEGNQQQRVFCNTNLSIASGCVAAAFVSRILYGKLEMVIVMNATLAGGVAIGTASDIITSPCGALWVGFAAGSFSAISFDKIGPFLADKINLQDTSARTRRIWASSHGRSAS